MVAYPFPLAPTPEPAKPFPRGPPYARLLLPLLPNRLGEGGIDRDDDDGGVDEEEEDDDIKADTELEIRSG